MYIILRVWWSADPGSASALSSYRSPYDSVHSRVAEATAVDLTCFSFSPVKSMVFK